MIVSKILTFISLLEQRSLSSVIFLYTVSHFIFSLLECTLIWFIIDSCCLFLRHGQFYIQRIVDFTIKLRKIWPFFFILKMFHELYVILLFCLSLTLFGHILTQWKSSSSFTHMYVKKYFSIDISLLIKYHKILLLWIRCSNTYRYKIK